MDFFNLPNDSINNYSLGMKQKLGIIQATMENQDLILLDEPYNGLDDNSIEILNTYLHKLKEQGTTILIVAHDSSIDPLLVDTEFKLANGNLTPAS